MEKTATYYPDKGNFRRTCTGDVQSSEHPAIHWSQFYIYSSTRLLASEHMYSLRDSRFKLILSNLFVIVFINLEF